MPHRHILDNPVVQPLDKQKLTIFQYFGTIVCVSCGQSSNKGICKECLEHPADSLVVLHEKLRRLDRTYTNVITVSTFRYLLINYYMVFNISNANCDNGQNFKQQRCPNIMIDKGSYVRTYIAKQKFDLIKFSYFAM